MDKGKFPMNPHTLNQTRDVSRFDPETAWREVLNNDIWKIRDGESIHDYKERMQMIKTKADRLCYDLELDLNKLHHLSESRKRVGSTQGEPSGVNYQEGPLEGEESDGDEEEDPEEEEEMEEEEPYEEVEPMEEGELHIKEESDTNMEQLGDVYLSEPPLAEPKVQAGSVFEMWEPKWESPSPIENSSEGEREDWGSYYDLYGFRVEFGRERSDEEDPEEEEEEEELPTNHPMDSNRESEREYTSSSTDSGDDGEDEDFDNKL
ncbi:unnamed protein product [Amaranthus hypochondriacus]